MREIRINSYEELNDLVFSNCYDEKTNRYRNDFVFRGQSGDYPLRTTLQRNCAHNLSLEDSIIRNFKKYGCADIDTRDSFWQQLATGQHFGLPTRLLDWTYSPLVAAHFATVETEYYDRDGVIYAMDMSDSYLALPECLKKELETAKSQCFTINMLDKHAKDLNELKSLSDKPFFLFFEPGSTNNRMINQYSVFSMSSDPNVRVDELLEGKENSLYKIIIPKEVKLEIRDKLDYINISERVIFPGLDSVCSWIKRRYSNLGQTNNKK